MDDLSGILESFLAQPDAMEQLRSMAQSLGFEPPAQEPDTQTARQSGLEDLISPAQLMALMGAMSEASAPNDSTSLLEALRPLLGLERQEKLNRAIAVVSIVAG